MIALRSQLVKGNAKTKLYRDYNSFDIKLFKEDFDKNLKSNNIVNFSDFQNTFTRVLHKHATIKKKILRFNNSTFMSKALNEKQLSIPVGTRYWGDIGFLLDLHRDIDRLRIVIEVTSLYNLFFQYHNDVAAIT